MTKTHHTICQTELGWLGLVWRDHAIVRLFMPERDAESVERRVARLDPTSEMVGPDQLPAFVQAAVELLHKYAAGESVDFSSTPVSAGDVGAMREAIYATLRTVGHGATLTYGELAARAGYPGMAREIGEAMGKNPVPIIVPCHRVVAAGGKIGGFSAPGGSKTKQRLLALEGVQVGPAPRPQAAFDF